MKGTSFVLSDSSSCSCWELLTLRFADLGALSVMLRNSFVITPLLLSKLSPSLR
ncbi:hypothetical protein F383_14855 [Gossypium arboreum]|uniref:Uncharacterized protein n=1 Tax=Gossypium arboreum TaxID=29729 RepID=A0A0B0NIX7_GOSAR|nr:hypothetical protein F383_14855 [Gossypium arboreum]